jgi:hypothetical protein
MDELGIDGIRFISSSKACSSPPLDISAALIRSTTQPMSRQVIAAKWIQTGNQIAG